MVPITVTREGDRWLIRFPFDRATIDYVKAHRCRFDPARKLWWTQDAAVAAKLGGADVGAAVEAARQEKAQAIAQSRVADSDFAIPLSQACRDRGLDFFPFQRGGVAYALQRPNVGIWDEMGLGKTLQAIGIANADESIKNVLVIAPASLKLNWQKEAMLWLARETPVVVANGSFPAGSDPGWVITNYEMIGKQRAQIDSVRWDMLVIDEAHYLKNSKAQRTAHVLGKWDSDPSKRVTAIAARRRVFLTGTPYPNRPSELWTLVHALDPQGLGRNWQAFVTRYCAGRKEWVGYGRRAKEVWNTNGSSHLDELQEKLRAGFMVRRLKQDVLADLPAKLHQVIALPCETPEAKAAIRAEAKFRETEARLNALRASLAAIADVDSAAYAQAAAALEAAESVAFEETSVVRHEVEIAKLPATVAFISDCLDNGEQKLVVFSHHHDCTDAIVEGLVAHLDGTGKRVLRADGRDSTAKREAAKLAFQGESDVAVIVCGLQAMGVGHTLTAASHVIFSSLDWSPGVLRQAEDRLHRQGQKQSVLVQHLVLDGSMDARMVGFVLAKTKTQDAGLDDALPIEAEIAASAPAEPAGEPKPVPAGAMPADQKDAIAAALRALAGVCDGARMEDGQGFNGRDADFGHKLAAQGWLSDRQAAVAGRMIIKYRRQIIAMLGDETYRLIRLSQGLTDDPAGK